MSGNPSTSAASSSSAKRAKPSTKPKSGKKSDSDLMPPPSSSMMSRMINTDGKPLTIEERTALGVQALLKDVNMKADDAAMEMLGELTRTICVNMLKDARTIAIHAERTDVQPDDVNYAARKYNIKQQSRMERAELAKSINSQELPKLRGNGLHLPVDRYCITQPTFQTAVQFKVQDVMDSQPSQVSTTSKPQSIGTGQVASLLKPQDDGYD